MFLNLLAVKLKLFRLHISKSAKSKLFRVHNVSKNPNKPAKVVSVQQPPIEKSTTSIEFDNVPTCLC